MSYGNTAIGTIELAKRGEQTRIYLSNDEPVAVRLAAENLAADIAKVCGANAVLSSEKAGCSIILQTIPDKNHWEQFDMHVSAQSLVITGSDRRGTIYGIYDFCETIGVSPWYFWADVPIQQKDTICVPCGYAKTQNPDVKYRGIFLNDEEELEAWAKKHTNDTTIGPETYRHVFELLLRLKANYIWPAMHVNYFNENPENGRLANEMGIVVGTSHCDMLLRSNQNEWHPWLASKGYDQATPYDYSIPGRNREILLEYWRESVEMNKDYEVCYTVGMRGIHDTGFSAREIDRNPDIIDKQEAKVQLLDQVIAAQRNILKETVPTESPLQLFIPYKETLPLYDRGLSLPEDVTLMWVDDNFGYMRRYPTKQEQSRSGGNGLYYHSSYWAAPGMSYLFFNSIPLAQTGNELRKCYENGIRNIWVLNVGALKPLEIDMEFFLRYAWDASTPLSPSEFLIGWFNRQFTGQIGEKAASLYQDFTQILNVCKIEHMESQRFSQTAYGDEAGQRLNRLKSVFDEATALYDALPEQEKEAFFQVCLMKMHAAFYYNAAFYYADRSILSNQRGNMQGADAYLALSRELSNRARTVLWYYNKKMCGGKWDGILTPESFPPPVTALYPAAKPALQIGPPGLGVSVWGEDESLTLTFYEQGVQEKWIELYNTGTGSIPYAIHCSPGIAASAASGTISDRETRIFVTMNQNTTEGIIEITSGEWQKTVTVRRAAHQDEFIELPADAYSRNNGFHIIPHLGRFTGPAAEAPGDTNAWIEYPFTLLSGGAYLLEIHRFLTLHSVGQIRFGLSIDGGEMITVTSPTRDEWTGNWVEAVLHDGERLTVELPPLDQGRHTLRLHAIDRYVTINRFVIYTQPQRACDLGPVLWKTRDLPPTVNEEELEALRINLYQTDFSELPLPTMVYGDKVFWRTTGTFVTNPEIPQITLGPKRYLTESDGSKDILAQFDDRIYAEAGGAVQLETEFALLGTKNACLTPSKEGLFWEHTQAETDGGTGLAMHIPQRHLYWAIPQDAPSMRYQIRVSGGKYHVWMLVKFDDRSADSVAVGVDGDIQPLAEQYGKGGLLAYSTKQIWFWILVTDLDIAPGQHCFSVHGVKSRLRIDRIYLTKGEEKPPCDANWNSK